jgi:DNA helicase-2/ATP-dependent DNA helicase PcrA
MTRAKRRLVLTHAETRAMHGGRDYRLPSRFLAEIPVDATSRPAAAPARRSVAGARPAGDSAFGAGDTVLHATFGEGVVTGVEARGSLVRVRFASDGTERRLMAGAAPMRKVG